MQGIVGGVAAFVGVGLHTGLLGIMGEKTAYIVSAFILSGVMVLTCFGTVYYCPERSDPIAKNVQLNLFHSIVVALKNDQYRCLLFCSALADMVLAFIASSQVLYLEIVLGLEMSGLMIVVSVFFVSACGGIYMYNALTVRIGKKKTLMVALFVAGVMQFPVYWIDEPYQYYLSLIPRSVGSFAISALLSSMTMDVMDMEECESGRRYEAIFNQIQNFIMKIVLGVTVAASNLALDGAGYILPDKFASSDSNEGIFLMCG